MLLNALKSKHLSDKSSNSHFSFAIPSLWARGTKISFVSIAISFLFSGERNCNVSILFNLSANFIIITLRSFANERKSLVKFSACLCSFERKAIFSTFVTPSTSKATSEPNSFSISDNFTSVSSTTSCNNALMTVVWSIFQSIKIFATSIQWLTKGKPDFRFCPWCILIENSSALSTWFLFFFVEILFRSALLFLVITSSLYLMTLLLISKIQYDYQILRKYQ